MTKADLVEMVTATIARTAGPMISKKDCARVVDAFLDAVKGTTKDVPGAKELEVTHLNLNDNTVEGLKHRELPIFAVQYHPEASPGPHDAQRHFQQFVQALDSQ